jgi:hypothetical protein
MRRPIRRRARVLLSFLPVLALAACSREAPRYSGPYERQVNRAMSEIESTMGLAFKAPPTLEERTRDEVRVFVDRQFNEQLTPLQLAGVQQAYRLFGLLPDTLDLRAFLLDLLEEQVAGYYDPATKVLYVVTDASPDIRDMTITHELVHALQDQYVALDSVQKLKGDNDRQVAMQAVFEGQAMFEQMASMLGGADFTLRLPGGWDRVREMIRSQQASMPKFASAPNILQETLLFPYLGGAEFARHVKRSRPADALYASLAASTEQILHPDRYLDSTPDIPTRISLGAPATGTLVHEDNLGEFEIRVLLYEHLRDQALATQGAAGWDGDRYQVVNTSGGAALAWVTVWDTSVEAAEFRDVMERSIERRYRVRPGTGGEGTTRRWTTARRRVLLSMESVGGRAAVIFEDAPLSIATRLLDVPRIVLTER